MAPQVGHHPRHRGGDGRCLRLQLPAGQGLQAQADLIYEQQLDVSNPLTGQTYTDPNARSLELASVDAIIKSAPITERVDARLEAQGLPTTGYEVRSELAQPADATTTQASNVVSIFATSEDPELAAAASQAYADGFVEWRKDRVLNQIDAAITAVEEEMRNYSGSKGSSDYLILQQRLRDLEILEATVTGNFSMLVEATVPDRPVLAEAAAQRVSASRRALARHRARLPARAVRHARAAPGRRRRAAPPACACRACRVSRASR